MDLTAPRLSVPPAVRVTHGKTAKIACTVKDAFSPTVRVGAAVADRAGRTVATLPLRTLKRGTSSTLAWRPKRRGTYTVSFRAVDRGGNRLAAPAVTTLKVR